MVVSQHPLPGGATITLSIPSGRLRWLRCLHLLPDDTPDVADLRAQREESKDAELAKSREAYERLRWNARYEAALQFAADRPKPGPLIPKVPRLSSLPMEVL